MIISTIEFIKKKLRNIMHKEAMEKNEILIAWFGSKCKNYSSIN